jgi:hypothetical protein
MKTKIALLVISSSLLLATQALPAQNPATNAIPRTPTNAVPRTPTNSLSPTETAKYQAAVEHDRSLGQRAMLPPGLKEKMKLTSAQRAELKPFEEEFANASKQYQAANQSRIDDAKEASRRARASKDPVQIQAARKQLQDIWVGLQRERQAAVYRIKPLLTPEQLKVLEDEKNQWRSDDDEVNDPSVN